MTELERQLLRVVRQCVKTLEVVTQALPLGDDKIFAEQQTNQCRDEWYKLDARAKEPTELDVGPVPRKCHSCLTNPVYGNRRTCEPCIEKLEWYPE
jgi:hypothetical protein